MTLTPAHRREPLAVEASHPQAGGRPRSGSARAGRWLARLALLALAVLLPLLAIEAALRVFGPIIPGNYRTGSFQAAHPVYGRFHVAGFDGWIRNPEFVARMKTNSLGLRDDEVVLPKPPGTFRILVVGDSFVQASQVSVGQPFTEVLERSLNASPPRPGRPERYDVVNAGVGGWGPAEEYLWLKNEGLRLQPDLVILQLYLGNDVSDSGCKILGQDEYKHKVCFYFDRDGRLYQDELRPRPAQPGDAVRTTLRNHTMLFNALETGVFEKLEEGTRDSGAASNWKSNMGVYAKSPPRREREEWDEAWDVAGALVGEIKRESEAAGARFVLTAVPSVYQVYRDEWDQAVAANRLRPEQWDLERPNQRLGETASRLGASYLDLGPAFRDEAPTAPRLFYHLDRHFTPAGHEVVARHVEAFLRGSGLVP